MSRKDFHFAKSALELIEEAVHLLRRAPVDLLGRYYIGTAPFVLGLLFFWADMSTNAFAHRYCASASLGLAVLFVWMKTWQAVFSQHLRAFVNATPPPPWPFQRVMRLVWTQAVVQSTGLLVLPAALAATLPLPWVYAFYQNACVQESGGSDSLKELRRRAWRQATLWPGQNHLALLILSLFGTVVFLNVGVAIFYAPYLVKTLLGVETMFTMSGVNALNTTFLAACGAVTYLAMDPLVKAFYCLRCFYGESRQTGEDLRAEISALPLTRTLAAAIALACLSLPAVHLFAAEENPRTASSCQAPSLAAPPEALEQSIRIIVQQREFTWRMPREAAKRQESTLPGPLAALLEWIEYGLTTAMKTIDRWITAFLEWLEGLLPEPSARPSKPGADGTATTRIVFLSFLAALGGILLFFLWRLRQKRPSPPAAHFLDAPATAPDLTDSNTTGEELPAHRWITLARELLDKGSPRMALRAFYLAALAHLAARDLLTIVKHKTNQDYVHELQRRARQEPDLLTAFRENVALFDAAWYGMHEVTQEMLAAFTANQERIMTGA